MIAQLIGFLIRNLPAVLFVLAFVITLSRRHGSAVERHLAWILLLPIGVTGYGAGRLGAARALAPEPDCPCNGLLRLPNASTRQRSKILNFEWPLLPGHPRRRRGRMKAPQISHPRAATITDRTGFVAMANPRRGYRLIKARRSAKSDTILPLLFRRTDRGIDFL